MSIRYKIFGAFSVVILLACGLAFYGIRGISTAGDQVVRLYDGPLMGINHARSAHAGLNEARLIMQRSLAVGATSEAVARFEKLVRNISEDLTVVRDRVQSANVKAAREKAESQPPRLVGRRTEDPQAGAGWPDRDPHDLLADAAGR
jgi:methyl-accepting chemotaxis protein